MRQVTFWKAPYMIVCRRICKMNLTCWYYCKIMVPLNIETEMDGTNGTRGEIVDIVLNPNEDPTPLNVLKVCLEGMPEYVLVKLNNTRLSQPQSLPPQVIPIEPNAVKFKIMVQNSTQTIVHKARQYVTSSLISTPPCLALSTLPTFTLRYREEQGGKWSDFCESSIPRYSFQNHYRSYRICAVTGSEYVHEEEIRDRGTDVTFT